MRGTLRLWLLALLVAQDEPGPADKGSDKVANQGMDMGQTRGRTRRQ